MTRRAKGKTGYQMVFKRLKTQEEKVIKHGLQAFSLVDAYDLDYFQVLLRQRRNAGRTVLGVR